MTLTTYVQVEIIGICFLKIYYQNYILILNISEIIRDCRLSWKEKLSILISITYVKIKVIKIASSKDLAYTGFML